MVSERLFNNSNHFVSFDTHPSIGRLTPSITKHL